MIVVFHMSLSCVISRCWEMYCLLMFNHLPFFAMMGMTSLCVACHVEMVRWYVMVDVLAYTI